MLRVTTVDGTQHTVDADAWHVDDHHGLHLQRGHKNPVATFAATKWIAVQKVNDARGPFAQQ